MRSILFPPELYLKTVQCQLRMAPSTPPAHPKPALLPASCLVASTPRPENQPGVFPQLHPPHPVMKVPWDSIFSAYQMCFKKKNALIPTLCIFHLLQPLNCLQLCSPKLYHPQSSQKCLVFKTSLPYMFTLKHSLDLQAKRMCVQVPGTPSSVLPLSVCLCICSTLWTFPVWTALPSHPPTGHVTSPPGLIEASSDSPLAFMVLLQWSPSLAAPEW